LTTQSNFHPTLDQDKVFLQVKTRKEWLRAIKKQFLQGLREVSTVFRQAKIRELM
jgi:hypothetical protein